MKALLFTKQNLESEKAFYEIIAPKICWILQRYNFEDNISDILQDLCIANIKKRYKKNKSLTEKDNLPDLIRKDVALFILQKEIGRALSLGKKGQLKKSETWASTQLFNDLSNDQVISLITGLQPLENLIFNTIEIDNIPVQDIENIYPWLTQQHIRLILDSARHNLTEGSKRLKQETIETIS